MSKSALARLLGEITRASNRDGLVLAVMEGWPDVERVIADGLGGSTSDNREVNTEGRSRLKRGRFPGQMLNRDAVELFRNPYRGCWRCNFGKNRGQARSGKHGCLATEAFELRSDMRSQACVSRSVDSVWLSARTLDTFVSFSRLGADIDNQADCCSLSRRVQTRSHARSDAAARAAPLLDYAGRASQPLSMLATVMASNVRAQGPDGPECITVICRYV
eukprot:6175791-Pleurochrysis_carterae.AAC.1